MKFEELPVDETRKYKLTLEGEEVEAVAAAYREHIFNSVRKDQTEVISDFDATVADWPENRTKSWISFNDPEVVLKKLDDFVNQTAEAIHLIPEQTKEPPFKSRQIPERYWLGQVALGLTNQIRGEFYATKIIKEVLEECEQGEGEAAAEAT
jgi:hypothetical protein